MNEIVEGLSFAILLVGVAISLAILIKSLLELISIPPLVGYLLSYRIIGEDLELIMIDSHENYYRDLKSYLKNR